MPHWRLFRVVHFLFFCFLYFFFSPLYFAIIRKLQEDDKPTETHRPRRVPPPARATTGPPPLAPRRPTVRSASGERSLSSSSTTSAIPMPLPVSAALPPPPPPRPVTAPLRALTATSALQSISRAGSSSNLSDLTTALGLPVPHRRAAASGLAAAAMAPSQRRSRSRSPHQSTLLDANPPSFSRSRSRSLNRDTSVSSDDRHDAELAIAIANSTLERQVESTRRAYEDAISAAARAGQAEICQMGPMPFVPTADCQVPEDLECRIFEQEQECVICTQALTVTSTHSQLVVVGEGLCKCLASIMHLACAQGDVHARGSVELELPGGGTTQGAIQYKCPVCRNEIMHFRIVRTVVDLPPTPVITVGSKLLPRTVYVAGQPCSLTLVRVCVCVCVNLMFDCVCV
jgi:hypothetical protein